jgi:hypothetical protein
MEFELAVVVHDIHNRCLNYQVGSSNHSGLYHLELIQYGLQVHAVYVHVK